MSTEPERICTTCRHCRSIVAGVVGSFDGQDRAYCAEPVIMADAGQPVPCEAERFNPDGACGTPGHLWTPR